jgi:hypothetical protein
MNTIERSVTRWRRFVQAGLILVLCSIATTGIIALHVLHAESAKPPVLMLAGGLLWIAILLWGIFSLQMMAFLNTKCSVIPWRRFVQVVGSFLVPCLLFAASICTLHVLKAESAKASEIMLAGGLIWIGMLLWGIFFLQMMAFLNTKCRNAEQPNTAL